MNLNVEFEYLIVNIAVDYWLWMLNVTGDESDMKDSGYIMMLQNSNVFVSEDVLALMIWGGVVLVVADYCAQWIVG